MTERSDAPELLRELVAVLNLFQADLEHGHMNRVCRTFMEKYGWQVKALLSDRAAIRNAALEEAAGCAENLPTVIAPFMLKDAATRIRALKTAAPAAQIADPQEKEPRRTGKAAASDETPTESATVCVGETNKELAKRLRKEADAACRRGDYLATSLMKEAADDLERGEG